MILSKALLIRTRLLLMIALIVVVGGIWLTRSDQSEVVLSTGMVLTPEWQELRANPAMQTTGDWSELILELPGLGFDDSKNLHVEGYLTTDTGERISFDNVNPVQFGKATCVQFTSSVLKWKRRAYSFPRVNLRSDRSLTIGKVIWISYDPSATKDGVAFPRALSSRSLRTVTPHPVG